MSLLLNMAGDAVKKRFVEAGWAIVRFVSPVTTGSLNLVLLQVRRNYTGVALMVMEKVVAVLDARLGAMLFVLERLDY